jgi:hypothetical protein
MECPRFYPLLTADGKGAFWLWDFADLIYNGGHN